MARAKAERSAPVEHVENFTCPQGHAVEVHWTDGQKAECWQCPECLVTFHHEEVAKVVADPTLDPDARHHAVQAAGRAAHERSLVRFDDPKRSG